MGIPGEKPWSQLNLEIWRYADRIKKHEYPIQFSIREDNNKERFWDTFFSSEAEGNLFPWKLYDELAEALEKTELTGVVQFPEEIPLDEGLGLTEGAKKTIVVNVYERSSQARNACIKHWGTDCCVCGIDFGSKYGEIGKGFIHIHHLTPLSSIEKDYEINPIEDLRPVCPNCHAMLHKENPPLSIEALKNLIN
ncbi:MAG: HNH endonuclease [Flavobacteriales bacterium]|nr:HNH endonuclease [Flavobacteriales bacterium]